MQEAIQGHKSYLPCKNSSPLNIYTLEMWGKGVTDFAKGGYFKLTIGYSSFLIRQLSQKIFMSELLGYSMLNESP